MTGGRNVKGGLVMLGVGLVAGLAMSLYAFKPMLPVPESLAHYDDLPRRLFRLGHIAAVMLPIINIIIGGWLDRLRLARVTREIASWLLLIGGILLPASLTIEALVPPMIDFHLSALPALAFTGGAVIAGAGAMRTPFDQEARHAGRGGSGAKDVGDRAAAFQEGRRA